MRKFADDLLICREYYKNETLHKSPQLENPQCWKQANSSCPKMCTHGGVLYSAFTISLDNSFLLENVSILKFQSSQQQIVHDLIFVYFQESQYTMIVLPLAKTSNGHQLIEYLQDELSYIVLPKQDVSLAGYDFGEILNLIG